MAEIVTNNVLPENMDFCSRVDFNPRGLSKSHCTTKDVFKKEKKNPQKGYMLTWTPQRPKKYELTEELISTSLYTHTSQSIEANADFLILHSHPKLKLLKHTNQ